MALQELERKLAESFDGLREENKSLIDFLKHRQSQLKSTLSPGTVLCSETMGSNKEQQSLHPLLSHMSQRGKVQFNPSHNKIFLERDNVSCEESEAPPLITEGQQQKARYNLAKSVNNQVTNHVQETHGQPHISTREGTTSQRQFELDTNARSVLRRRQIIDNNVHVTSKYQHTPTGTPKMQRKYGLNFSYSDSDSDDSIDYRVGQQFQDVNNELAELEERKQQRSLNKEMADIEQQMAQRLLDDPGNDRQHASVVKTIRQRPKNRLFDVNEKEPLDETLSSMNNSKASEHSSARESFMSRLRSLDGRGDDPRDTRPLLGYDWIAGVLENEGLITETEGLFKEVEEFRRDNREDCVGSASVWDKSLDLRRPISPEIEDPGHTCIHSYSLNDRLFTESVNLNERGKSVCPVCLISRKTPTKEDPAFVRVSIPKSSFADPYKVVPHKRKSYDPSDSYALSKHCLAGWQNAKPSMLPTASTLDLKDKVIPKDTTSYDEARKVAESFSRMGRLLDGKDLPEDRLAKELIQRTHCLRYELEMMRDTFSQSQQPSQQLQSC